MSISETLALIFFCFGFATIFSQAFLRMVVLEANIVHFLHGIIHLYSIKKISYDCQKSTMTVIKELEEFDTNTLTLILTDE